MILFVTESNYRRERSGTTLPEVMVKAFEIAGYPEDEVKQRFGAMYQALRFGAPPHGGSAPGIDRIVMLIADAENLREVVAFPFNQQAEDLLMGAPAQVEDRQLKGRAYPDGDASRIQDRRNLMFSSLQKQLGKVSALQAESAFRSIAGLYAGYNIWANQRMYSLAATMTDTHLREDQGAFFGSMLGTLSHILRADRIWLASFSGSKAQLHETPPFERLSDLYEERKKEDLRILTFVENLGDADTNQPIRYRRSNGELHENPLGPLVLHMFNHQTHHRGQAHTIATSLGYAPGSLDMLEFMHESEPKG